MIKLQNYVLKDGIFKMCKTGHFHFAKKAEKNIQDAIKECLIVRAERGMPFFKFSVQNP